jgi:hypothetical protein
MKFWHLKGIERWTSEFLVFADIAVAYRELLLCWRGVVIVMLGRNWDSRLLAFISRSWCEMIGGPH